MGLMYSVLLLGRGSSPSEGALITGEYWFLVFALGSSALGAFAALVVREGLSVPAAAAAAVIALQLLVWVKRAVWPSIPAVGDGWEIISALFALAAAGAAALTVRMGRSPAQVAYAFLASLAAALGVSYLLAAVWGS